MAGLVSVTLADSGVIPYQLNRSVHELTSSIHKMINVYGSVMPNATIGNHSRRILLCISHAVMFIILPCAMSLLKLQLLALIFGENLSR
jgi:hypothetical protein